MKVAILVGVLVAGAVPASADTGSPVRAQLKQRFDRNGDGRLEPRERMAARRFVRRRIGLYVRLVARFDRDGDGRLGPGELPPKLAARLARFDADGDGWVQPRELLIPPRRAP